MIPIADYSVIADIGLSLVKVLRAALVPELVSQPDGVGLGNPADRGDMNVTVYLYEIKENTDVRSQDMVDMGDRMRYPGVALDLFYIVTAHSTSDILTRGIDEQRMLGKIIQLLHDHPMLAGDDLEGALTDSTNTYRISKEQLPLETLVSLFPNQPYKLSLGYKVGPVTIDSTRTRSVSRVSERQFKTKQLHS